MLPKLLQCVAFHVGILFAGAFLHLAVPFYKEKVQKRCELLALSLSNSSHRCLPFAAASPDSAPGSALASAPGCTAGPVRPLPAATSGTAVTAGTAVAAKSADPS